jgi:hypothetical protein
MKNTFLYKVWLHNKKLFYILTVFAGLTICCNLLGDEVTPFFVWGMYSAKEQPVQEYEILKTTINDSLVVNQFNYQSGDTRFYLTTPLALYKKIKENNGQDPTVTFLQSKLQQHYHDIGFPEKKLFNTGLQKQDFLNWYARYLEQVTKINITSVRIDLVKAHYNNQNLITDSVYLFEKWEKP